VEQTQDMIINIHETWNSKFFAEET